MSVSRIEARRVSRRFVTTAETVVAIDDASLDARGGEFVSLMGPSGCGKSTFLSVLSGILLPDGGEVLIDGQSQDGMTAEQRARTRLTHVGVVQQRDGLVDELSAAENVALPLELAGAPWREAKERAGEALERVGIGDLSSRRPSQLSGGQRQRVAIARGIVGERRILLADEATGAVDHQNARLIFGLFRDLAAAGWVVVAATHDHLVAEYAHRRVRMIDGRFDEQSVSSDRTAASA